MKCYFLSSSHTEDRIWFRDDDDFISGMNCVAIAALNTGVYVLAFVLMSNHVHFLLIVDDKSRAKDFFDLFKNLYSRHMHKKYGFWRFLRENQCDYRDVFPAEVESVERVVAYILMNPVAANISLNANSYPWGSGDCYFSRRKPFGRRAGDFSAREKCRILKTTIHIPDEYIIEEGGYILPSSYIHRKFVEDVFRTPKRMEYFLMSSSKARLDGTPAPLPTFRDQNIAGLAKDIALSLFRKEGIADLEPGERDRLILEVRRRTGADVKQLSRVLGISPKEIASIQ